MEIFKYPIFKINYQDILTIVSSLDVKYQKNNTMWDCYKIR